MHWTVYIKYFAGLFAVLNPLGAIPLFASLTNARPEAERAKIARITSLTVLSVLGIAFVGGDLALALFGITLGSFRVGGGILLLLMAIAMLHARRSGAKNSPEETMEAMQRSEIAVAPLGIPLLAGPGAISTAILYRQKIHTPADMLAMAVILLALTAIIYIMLRHSAPLVARIGRTGLNVSMRIMGLILAALAVEFIADGLKDLFPMLAR